MQNKCLSLAIKSKCLVMSSVDVMHGDVKTSGVSKSWGKRKTKMTIKIMNVMKIKKRIWKIYDD